MKKIILFLMLALLSCSSDDGIFVNKPSWIEGTWKRDVTGDLLTITKSDIIYNNKYSFSGQKQIAAGSSRVEVISNNSTSYVVDFYQIKGGVPLRFSFFKKTENEMISNGHLPGNYKRK